MNILKTKSDSFGADYYVDVLSTFLFFKVGVLPWRALTHGISIY